MAKPIDESSGRKRSKGTAMLTEDIIYRMEPTDLVLFAYEHKAVMEQFMYDLCMRLYTYGLLDLDLVQERSPDLWAKLKKEATSRFGSYDFTAREDHLVASMFLNAARAGVFTEQFMDELRRGLGKLAGTDRHAKNILHPLTIPENYRTKTVEKNGKRRKAAVNVG
jgi:hypothetical protein